MTAAELGTLVANVAKAAQAPLLERIAILEARLDTKASIEEKQSIAEFTATLDLRILKLEKAPPIVVEGPPGPAGAQGEPGARGEAGPAGECGPTGSQGVPGPIGERGLQGEKGEQGIAGKDGAPGPEGQKGIDGTVGPVGPDGRPGDPGRDGQPGVPGREGERGEKGLDGANGKDGADGRDGTLENIRIEQDDADERLVRFLRKDGSELGGFRVPGVIYREVWQADKTYTSGDMVTLSGSTWAALKDTSDRPGTGSPAWRLAVKCGRDGKDGKDGKNGLDGKDGKDRIVR